MPMNKEHPTAEVEAVELLPCPFCGESLEKWGRDEWHHDGACDCPLSDAIFDEEQMENWSRRTSLSTKDRELVVENERLREALEAEDAYWSASRVLAAAFARIRPQAQAAFDAAMERRNKARAALQGSAS